MKPLITPVLLGLVTSITAVSCITPKTGAASGRVPSFEKTCRMRDAAGCEADWGTESIQMGMKVFTNDSKKLARMFQDDEGAVMCQGAAYYLHLRYLEAGYRSYLAGFQSKAMSHSVVLVEAGRKEGTRGLVVQDPSFNVSYVDGKGNALTIFEIMNELAARRHSNIHVHEGNPPVVDFLWHPEDRDPRAGSPFDLEFAGPSTANPSLKKYRATLSHSRFFSAKLNKNAVTNHCTSEGLPCHFLYAIFDRPIYIFKGYPMSAENQAEADGVLAQLKKTYKGLRSEKRELKLSSVAGR
jgi:hypothetical protein